MIDDLRTSKLIPKLLFQKTINSKSQEKSSVDKANRILYTKNKSFNKIYISKTELEEAVREARKNREWRHEYMTLLMRDLENQQKGLEEGIKIGEAQGIKIGEAQGIKIGEAQGEDRYRRLSIFLMKNGHMDEFERSLIDKDYLNSLYEKYGI